MPTSRPTATQELKGRILKMVNAFEGGSLAGDFDGQILSWGPLQWNLGQRTLDGLLKRIESLDPAGFRKLMGDELADAINDPQTLRAFAKREILDATGRPRPEWRQRFALLALEPETRAAFVEHAASYFARAEKDARSLALTTERGLALCMDVAVQNGGVRKAHLATYRSGRPEALPMEWQRLKLLAAAVASHALPRWREDVLSRKLTVALGRGTVHGRHYELERDFGIAYARAWAAPAADL